MLYIKWNPLKSSVLFYTGINRLHFWSLLDDRMSKYYCLSVFKFMLNMKNCISKWVSLLLQKT
jgi:hypothetical protein